MGLNVCGHDPKLSQSRENSRWRVGKAAADRGRDEHTTVFTTSHGKEPKSPSASVSSKWVDAPYYVYLETPIP